MDRKERKAKINQLKQDDFRVVKNHPDLYIDAKGTVRSLSTGKTLKIDSKNRVLIDRKRVNVPKLILAAFRGEPYRKGQIAFIDGNKGNLTPNNIKYTRILAPDVSNNVNKADMLTAIKCYFEVEKRFNLRDTTQTKLYLQGITAARRFFDTHKKAPHIGLFNAYVSELLFSKVKAAKSYGIESRDGQEIINGFLNMLIGEVLADLGKGVLTLQGYEPPPKNDRQLLIEWGVERDKK